MRTILTLALLFFLSASAFSAPAQVFSTTKTLTTEIQDAITGAPIQGAAVLLLEERAVRSTNGLGRARFGQIPLATQSVTIWIESPGYVPTVKVIPELEHSEYAVILLTPGPKHTTGLVDAAVGGTFYFSGEVFPGADRFYEVELAIPPFALPEDASLEFTPYANWINSQPGVHDDDISLGSGFLLIRNQQGDPLPPNLAAPMTVSIRPWGLPNQPNDIQAGDEQTLQVYALDLRQGRFVPRTSTTSVNVSDNRFIVDTISLGSFNITLRTAQLLSIFNRESDDPPATPSPVMTTVESVVCDLDLQRNVNCGFPDATGSFGEEKGTEVEVSSEVSDALEAEFGAEFGIKLLKKIEVQGGAKWKKATTEGESNKITITKDMSGSISPDTSVSGPKQCVSGQFYGYTVLDSVEVFVDGVSVGSLEIPTGSATELDLTFDTACPGCVDIPQYNIKTGNPCPN